MIDEKRIKEAASSYVGGKPDAATERISVEQASFMDGALWAQREFLNSLWHDTSEEPKSKDECSSIFALDRYKGIKEMRYREEYGDWERIVIVYDMVAWCYVDDLLPKKGSTE